MLTPSRCLLASLCWALLHTPLFGATTPAPGESARARQSQTHRSSPTRVAVSLQPSLREACVSALDGLLDLEQPHHQWSVYPNKDPLAIIALCEGASLMPEHPHAPHWLETARRVADAWLACAASDYPAPLVHFGLRIAPRAMTFNWRRLAPQGADHNTMTFYLTGYWIHALARLYAVSGEVRDRQRAEAMIGYLCGDNPWHLRLFNELGGVYNWVDDTDGDGIEDWLKQDMYPESTAIASSVARESVADGLQSSNASRLGPRRETGGTWLDSSASRI